MKILSLILICIISVFVIYLYSLGMKSRSGHAAGLDNGKLTRCPATPNCVNSEYHDQAKHYIDPIIYSDSNKPAISPIVELKRIISQLGGSIHSEEKHYLAATFTSNLFRFVDDVEIRLDEKNKLIHLRSASRVGRGDMGVNKKRVTQIKNLYEKINPENRI